MKNFFKVLLFFAIMGGIIYFIFIKLVNNKDEYDRLYDKYLKDSNFECKILECTSDSNVEISGISFSLNRDLNVNKRTYNFVLKNSDILFSGAYNLIDGEEKMGIVFSTQITFIFNVGDIHYSGIYHVSDHNLALTPQYTNYDISNYMKHSELVKEICEYIVESVKNDLET